MRAVRGTPPLVGARLHSARTQPSGGTRKARPARATARPHHQHPGPMPLGLSRLHRQGNGIGECLRCDAPGGWSFCPDLRYRCGHGVRWLTRPALGRQGGRQGPRAPTWVRRQQPRAAARRLSRVNGHRGIDTCGRVGGRRGRSAEGVAGEQNQMTRASHAARRRAGAAGPGQAKPYPPSGVEAVRKRGWSAGMSKELSWPGAGPCRYADKAGCVARPPGQRSRPCGCTWRADGVGSIHAGGSAIRVGAGCAGRQKCQNPAMRAGRRP